MAEEYRNRSYAEENASAGVLFSAWTQKWGLKVYPWYGMDKIKFSFIEKGAKGKGNSCDICIHTIKDYAFTFEDLKHEVLHDIRTPYDFLQVMTQEKEHPVINPKTKSQIPGRYKFITGKNGEKYVGIMPSNDGKGFVICGQAVINGKYVHPMLKVSYYDIYNIVKAYDETYEERRQELKKMRLDGIRELESHYSKQDYDDDPDPAGYAVQNEAGYVAEGTMEYSAQVPENTAEVSAPEPGPVQTAAEPAAPAPEANTQDKRGIHVATSSQIAQGEDGDYFVKAKKDDGSEITIRVPKTVADSVNTKNQLFSKFIDKVNASKTEFSFSGIKRRKGNGAVEYVFAAFC